jgi:NAD(P)-dependent dehydrogenase (short-subunit alcohol dehydrogenase family)
VTATYVISGGSDEIVSDLTSHLRASQILRLADGSTEHASSVAGGSQRALASLGAELSSWIHVLPDVSCASAGRALGDAARSVLAASACADAYLPTASGASLTLVVPSWGTVAPELEAHVELAAAAARAAMQTRIERWSSEGRRVNIVRFVPPPGVAWVGFRDAGTLGARTPMHRLSTTAELADAIDFLGSKAAAYVTGSTLDVDGGWNAYSWFYPARDL